MKDKKYYKKIWNDFWNECLEKAKQELIEDEIDYDDGDIRDVATEIFEESANTEQIVGYYIEYHGKSALRIWKKNTDGLDFTEKDKEIDAILKSLY